MTINQRLKTSDQHESSGFTLIELLVAVAIFAILTALAVVSYTSANRRARDGRRRSDLEQVRTALEIYRADNTSYPVGTNFTTMVNTLVAGNYLSTATTDPRGYGYYYNSATGVDYYVCGYLETGGPANCGANCAAPGNCNYRVDSP